MRALPIGRANAGIYLVLVCLFCLVVSYQVRISLDTVHVERYYDFFVPFLLEPFTDRVDAKGFFSSWEHGREQFDAGSRSLVRWRDQLVRVNGRPFRGISVYLRELLRSEHEPPASSPDVEWHPFMVTVRSSDAAIHDVDIGFPHCTCGSPTLLEGATIWLVPPLFCILAGFSTVFLRPRALLSWAFFTAMLSLSQLRFWPEWVTGFQLIATPMAWPDLMRVPAVGYRAFVQDSWPAALLLGLAHFNQSRRGLFRLLMGLAGVFVVYAGVEGALQIAWSENYRSLAWLYRLLEQHRSELMGGSFAAIAAVALCLNRSLGMAVAGFGVLAMGALWWNVPPITDGYWSGYSLDVHRFEVTVPVVHNTHGFIVLLFTTGCLMAGLIFMRRRVMGLEVAGILLCGPLAFHVAASIGGYWYPFGRGPFEYWPWFILSSAGIGLAGIAWSVLRRTSVDS